MTQQRSVLLQSDKSAFGDNVVVGSDFKVQNARPSAFRNNDLFKIASRLDFGGACLVTPLMTRDS
jgi:hypothetical protein